jgi:hypothetical protein
MKDWLATARTGTEGEIFAIALASNEDRAGGATQIKAYNGEEALLRSFANFYSVLFGVDDEDAELPTLVVDGGNIHPLRVIWQRLIAHGLEVPAGWPINLVDDEASPIYEVTTAWTGRSARTRIAFDTLADVLNVPGQTHYDWQRSYHLHAGGLRDEAIAMDLDDVRRLRCVYRRMQGLPLLDIDLAHLDPSHAAAAIPYDDEPSCSPETVTEVAALTGGPSIDVAGDVSLAPGYPHDGFEPDYTPADEPEAADYGYALDPDADVEEERA